jgi:hypothetical protein
MKSHISHSFLTRALFSLAIPAVLGLAGQLVSAQTAGQYNVFKEVMAKKDAIVWREAPENLIPAPVCNLLQACAGNPDKLIVLAPTTENGQKVGRGLILTKLQDAKHSDALLMLDQGLDVYFFLVSPDGTLQKAAYHQAGGTSWLAIASSLAQPTFDKDKKLWHDRVAQLGGAPAAAKPAAPAAPAAQ